MNMLVINTACKKPEIGILGETVKQIISLTSTEEQTERLIPEIDAMLRCNDLALVDLSSVFVISGPGSFTALRIGIITAQAISDNLKIPLLSMDTFEYLKIVGDGSPVLIHAGGDEVYFESNEIVSFEKFLENYNSEPVYADISERQQQHYGSKIKFAAAINNLLDAARIVLKSPKKYKVQGILAPNYVKKPNIHCN